MPSDPLRVSVATLGADGKATATFTGRMAAGGEVHAAGAVASGGSARLRFDRGGMVGRGDAPSWFKSDGATELAMSSGVAEHVYKGGVEEITVLFDGQSFAIMPGAPKSK